MMYLSSTVTLIRDIFENVPMHTWKIECSELPWPIVVDFGPDSIAKNIGSHRIYLAHIYVDVPNSYLPDGVDTALVDTALNDGVPDIDSDLVDMYLWRLMLDTNGVRAGILPVLLALGVVGRRRSAAV
jgi:hypothetical protein